MRIAVTTKPHAMTPADALTREDWLLVGAIHEPLIRLNPQGEPTPNLLAKLPVRTKSKRSWLCTLRPDIFFHSDKGKSKRMRARDVKQSIAKLQNTRFAWVPRLMKIRPTGKLTFRLTLKQTLSEKQLGLLLASPALSILPSKGKPFEGAGPFRVKQWDRHLGSVHLQRYDRHHRGAPYLDGLRLETARNAMEAAEWFRHERVDVVFDDSVDPLDKLPDSLFSRAIRLSGPIRESVGIIFNRHRPPIRLEDRQQVMHSVERDVTKANITGKTRISKRLVPVDVARTPIPAPPTTSHSHISPWRIGCPTMLQKACKDIAYGIPDSLTPQSPTTQAWPTVPLTWAATLDAVHHPKRAGWDALVLSVVHVDPWPTGALHTLATMALGQPTDNPKKHLMNSQAWIPLVERRLFLVHAPTIQNLRWSTATLLDMGGVWIQ